MALVLKMERVYQEGDFPLVIMPMGIQAAIGPHAHEFTELVIITAGQGVHVAGQDEYPILAGDAFVVPIDQEHAYRDTEDLSLINILFDPAGLKLPECDVRELPGYHALFSLEPYYRRQHQFRSRLRLSMTQLEYVIELTETIRQELENQAAGYRHAATALLMQLILYLSRRYSETRMPDSRALLRVAEVVTYLEKNYTEEIALADLAALAHLSERSLLRTFREAMHVSPIDYLIRLRIKRACELLHAPGMQITAIAFRVGFTDSNYFTRQFRKITGVSPRAYRKRVRPQ